MGEPGGGRLRCSGGRAFFGDEAMDWRNAMVRTEMPHATSEDDAAYAAGWTISGLATLGTIIAVWMFAI
jgi:hypothetical protein